MKKYLPILLLIACHSNGPVDRRMTGIEDNKTSDSTLIKDRWRDSASQYYVLAEFEVNEFTKWSTKILLDSTHEITQADIDTEIKWRGTILTYISKWKNYVDSLGNKPVIKIIGENEDSLQKM